MATNLPLLAFNDVYRVVQRYVPQPGCDVEGPPDAEIGVGQFGELINTLRKKWSTQENGTLNGLVLFAGDVFNPSMESSVTRGSHMVPILNELKLDAACIGNHDFDFGYPHMTKLVGDTNFPWLLSNIVDTNTGTTPVPLHKFVVTERCGVRIGLVGLVEEDWIAIIPSWPNNFAYRPMKEVGLELSKELRDPKGPHRVDIIIAITHSRVPNDIKLAKELGAVSNRDTQNEHGIDLIIGGHDHVRQIGKGADSWEGFAGLRDKPGTREDDGVRLIKSGTDFRDLSEAWLELSPPNENAVRRRVITALTGKHHYVTPASPTSPELDKLANNLLESVNKTLKQPVCYTITPFDARSEVVRTQESALGNWAADVLLHAYDESLVEKNTRIQFEKGEGDKESLALKEGADAVIICGGTLRGDSQYGPGTITLGNILEIFPFDDPVVCLEIDGKGIWDTLESALSRWPAQEGRFPIVSGLAVDWDHRKPPGKRINSIHLTVQTTEHKDDDHDPSAKVTFVEQPDGTRIEIKQAEVTLGEEIKNVEGGRMYSVITREYMAQGFDGFEALKDRRMIVDHEVGQSMSSIIRSFLLGSSFIFRMKQLADAHHDHVDHICSRTLNVLKRHRTLHRSPENSVASSPVKAMYGHRFVDSPTASPVQTHFMSVDTEEEEGMTASLTASTWVSLRRHVIEHDWVTIREAMHMAKHEHMSDVDPCDGRHLRRKTILNIGDKTPRTATPTPGMLVDAKRKAELKDLGSDVAIVSPQVDGRMRDIAADQHE
ncbi:uncharacterized protein COLE_02621 [Cutaneotrichosporon oleaginosum]|uniref:uncharacterized protein n=1 Tax=Cutaneotrichosporon oleaginosum TaxID=879819 RepID=UPI00132A01AA|nr:hypothetical protein COLE_02621 [Cutaneotrichosporon oleaginosum]